MGPGIEDISKIIKQMIKRDSSVPNNFTTEEGLRIICLMDKALKKLKTTNLTVYIKIQER